MDFTTIKEEEILSTFKVDRTQNNTLLVQKLLAHLKDKDKRIKQLEKVVNSITHLQMVNESLRTLSSCTGLLNLHKDDQVIYQLSGSILHSLLNAFGKNHCPELDL